MWQKQPPQYNSRGGAGYSGSGHPEQFQRPPEAMDRRFQAADGHHHLPPMRHSPRGMPVRGGGPFNHSHGHSQIHSQIHSHSHHRGEHYDARDIPRGSPRSGFVGRQGVPVAPAYPGRNGRTVQVAPFEQAQEVPQLTVQVSGSALSTAQQTPPAAGGGCTCKKSKCLKLYCQCFASSATCGSRCKCLSCSNTQANSKDISEARRIILERNPSAFEDKFREDQPVAPRPTPYQTGPMAPHGPGSPRGWTLKDRMHQPHFQRGHSPQFGAHPQALSYREQQGYPRQMAPRFSAHPEADRFSRQEHGHAHAFLHEQGGHQAPRGYLHPQGGEHPPIVSATLPEKRVLSHKLGCKCSRSFCLKKYCECYHHGAKCGSNCRCINCRNKPEESDGPSLGPQGSVAAPVAYYNHAPRRQEKHVLLPSQPPPLPIAMQMRRNVPAPLLQTEEPLRKISYEDDDSTTDQPEAPPNSSSENKQDTSEKKEQEQENGQQRMAIMAALAMTQLFDSGSTLTTTDTTPPTPTPTATSEIPGVTRQVSTSPSTKGSKDEEDSDVTKRKISPDAEKTSRKKQKCDSSALISAASSVASPVGSTEGDIGVVSSSTMSPSTMMPTLHHPPMPSSHHGHQGYYYGNGNQQRFGMPEHLEYRPQRRFLQLPHGRAMGPGGEGGSRHGLLHGPFNGNPKISPTARFSQSISNANQSSTGTGTGSPKHDGSQYNSQYLHPQLPKGLSFRKICSRCGKTRGEHGELGFGNKCVFQDCGRCGAGVQMHIKANTPMGFLCSLTVERGAQPGAAASYEKKIHNLGVQAELQRGVKLQQSQDSESFGTPQARATAAV